MGVYQENSLNNTAVNKSRNRELVKTADGSFTLFIPEVEETYHSTHGAVQESLHVFIESGLKACDKEAIRILEVGLGTGLNAALTLQHATKKIHYHTPDILYIWDYQSQSTVQCEFQQGI